MEFSELRDAKVSEARQLTQRVADLDVQLSEWQARAHGAASTIAALSNRVEAAEASFAAETRARQAASTDTTAVCDTLLLQLEQAERERQRLEMQLSSTCITLEGAEVCVCVCICVYMFVRAWSRCAAFIVLSTCFCFC